MRMKLEKPAQDFFLRKVEYDEARQRQLLAEVLDLAVGNLEKASQDHSVADANNAIARCCQFVRVEAAEYFACFKHPAFSVEEEWRLCHVTGPTEEAHVLYREGAYGLTPYVELDPSPMAGVNANRLPIARITHSPTKDPTNVRFALSKMLRSKGYAFVEIAAINIASSRWALTTRSKTDARKRRVACLLAPFNADVTAITKSMRVNFG